MPAQHTSNWRREHAAHRVRQGFRPTGCAAAFVPFFMNCRFAILVFAVASAVLSTTAAAQGQPPQPQGLDPAALQRLQRAVQSSGLTPPQVRERLRAEGYAENTLDAYLGVGRDTSTVVTSDAFSALQALGILDSAAIDSLRFGRAPRQRARTDSAFADTVLRAMRDSATEVAIRTLLRNRSALRGLTDSGYSVFGQEVFRRETSQFDALLAGPVGPDYRIGPGDRLVLVLTGQTEAAHQLTVTREGFIVIPNVGQLPVANLTMGQLQALLLDRLGRVYSDIGRSTGNTQFSISMVRMGTIQVSVLGDVTVPGTYRISRVGSVLSALYAAGGPSELGSMRQLELKRGRSTVGRFDLYDYLLQGASENTLRPENGDVVFVPPRGSYVRIAGAVLRPATYELKAGETLADAIRMAGGFRADADRRRVQVERIVPAAERRSVGSDRTAMEISSPLLATAYGPAVPLETGDIVLVRAIPERVANRIVVSGNVWSGGHVARIPGMRLSQALKAAGGIKPDTYLEAVQVSRLERDSTRRILRTALADTTGTPADDFLLEDADEIRLFSLTEFRPQRYVVVNGAIRKSGRIAYRDGMTLRDAVMLAGGLAEGASLTEAVIARMPDTRERGRTATSFRVPLDSSYIFERNGSREYRGPPGVSVPASGAPDAILKPYDHVLILRQPEWTMLRTVVIGGEVRYPGPYTLESKTERLSDLIRKAGGLTADAYPGGISFIRTRDIPRSRRDTISPADSGRRAPRDSGRALRGDTPGRIGIDLGAALRNRRHPDNLLLVEGDSIFIPVLEQVVHVAGAVNSPIAMAYVPRAKLDYYILAAGGGTARADLKRAYVVQPNGKVESRAQAFYVFRASPEPRPGSTVLVPPRAGDRRWDVASILATGTSLLASIATIVLLLR